MKSVPRSSVLSACAALALPLLGCGTEPVLGESSHSSVVEFGVETLGGARFDPLMDERADLLLFVRTDCPISSRYAPELARIGERFGSSALDVWLIYVDPDETPEAIRAHVAEYHLPGTPLRDPGQKLAARAGVRVTPEAAVFDARGERRYHGRIDNWYADYGKPRDHATTHDLIDALTDVLSGRLPTVSEAPAVGCPLPPLADLHREQEQRK